MGHVGLTHVFSSVLVSQIHRDLQFRWWFETEATFSPASFVGAGEHVDAAQRARVQRCGRTWPPEREMTRGRRPTACTHSRLQLIAGRAVQYL